MLPLPGAAPARAGRRCRGPRHGLRGAVTFRSRVNSLESGAEVREAIEQFFGTTEIDHSVGEEQELDYRTAHG